LIAYVLCGHARSQPIHASIEVSLYRINACDQVPFHVIHALAKAVYALAKALNGGKNAARRR
jgi:hypothetical protein